VDEPARHEIALGDDDEAKANDALVPEVAEKRESYKVISEVGIFKNGKLYEQGETVELTEATAEAFREAGDIE
jgi:hypothetical protein